MKDPKRCTVCGRLRGDGRSDRGWKYLVVDVHQRRGMFVLGPIGLRVALCAQCWRFSVAPLFDDLEQTALAQQRAAVAS